MFTLFADLTLRIGHRIKSYLEAGTGFGGLIGTVGLGVTALKCSYECLNIGFVNIGFCFFLTIDFRWYIR